jgi:histidine triad (HIT) family protein
MYNHAPREYVCPFCLLVQGKENSDSQLRQTDIVFQTLEATAVMAAQKWPNNPGHVLVIPNRHFENIYDLPAEIANEIHLLSREIALAMKTVYDCDGITLQQSNEPAGDQKIWHYHLHVIARFSEDDFHNSHKESAPPDLRAEYARNLRSWIENQRESTNERSNIL